MALVKYPLRMSWLIVVTALIPVIVESAQRPQIWDFSVSLDGDDIGYHRFELTDLGDQQRIRSEAKFDVRFLFINAFRYRHENTEVWSEGCLSTIQSKTRANSKRFAITGEKREGTLVVDDGSGKREVGECVMTFAYWDPDFLRQPRLLNSQSGEYLDVEVEELGAQPVTVRGEEVPAFAYRLTAREMQVTLWYSSEDEWLALESVAKGGRRIRYELT